MNEPTQMEGAMFLTKAGTESLCFDYEPDTDINVVVLSEYKKKTKKSGRFYSPVSGFLSPDLPSKVLQGPRPSQQKKVTTRTYQIGFSYENKRLEVNIRNQEEFNGIHKILNSKFESISISSQFGCRKFDGVVKAKDKIEGTEASVYIFDVLSTDYDFNVTFYNEELVTICFEGVR